MGANKFYEHWALHLKIIIQLLKLKSVYNDEHAKISKIVKIIKFF